MEALHRNICFECNYHLNIEYGKTSVILPQMEGKKERKPIQQKQKAGIVTSLNDTTLTKVTYGKYALGSRMKWRMESTSGLVPSKTLSSI